MKKIILILILLTLFFFPISAEEYNQDGDYQLLLKYSTTPAYYVKIPTSVDISDNDTYFDIYVKGQIYCDQILKINFDEMTSISNANNQLDVYVLQEKYEYQANELNLEYSKNTINLKHNDLIAGEYSGTLNMVISLEGG